MQAEKCQTAAAVIGSLASSPPALQEGAGLNSRAKENMQKGEKEQ